MSKILQRSVAFLVLIACLVFLPATLAHAAPPFLTPVDTPQAVEEVAEPESAAGWLDVVLDRLAALFGIESTLDNSTDDGSCPDNGAEHGGGMDTGG